MQITISDKMVAKALGWFLDNNLYEMYGDSVIKAAGVPSRAFLITEMLADEKYTAKLAKAVSGLIYAEGVEEVMEQMNSPAILKKYYAACDKAEAALDKDHEREEDERELNAALELVRTAGYKISK